MTPLQPWLESIFQAQFRLERFLHRRRRGTWLGLLVVLAALYLSAASNELGGNLGGDNAQYLLLAKALAQGQGYVDLYLPNHPAHTKYPPLFPLLLAPLTWLGRYQLLGAHLLICTLALGVPLALASWVRRQGHSETAALGVLLLAATLPRYFQYLIYILSEVPFLVLCYFALYWMAKSASHPRTRDLLILTLTTLAALFTRTAGIALVAAIGIELFRQPRFRHLRLARIPGAAFFLSSMFLALIIWSLRSRFSGGSGLGYVQEFMLQDPYRPQLGYASLADLSSRFFSRTPFFLSLMALQVTVGKVFCLDHNVSGYGLILLIPIAIGLISRLGRSDRSAEGFFLFSALLMSVWWYEETRFLLPLLPLASFYLLLGIRRSLEWVWAWFRIPRAGILARSFTLVIGLLILMVQAWSLASLVRAEHADRIEPAVPVLVEGYGPWREPVINWSKYDYQLLSQADLQLFTRVLIIHRIAGQKVPPGQVVLSRKPTLTAWFTSRTSVCYLFTDDTRAQWQFLRRNQVAFVIVQVFDSEMKALFQSCPDCFQPLASFAGRSPALYQIVHYPAGLDTPPVTF